MRNNFLLVIFKRNISKDFSKFSQDQSVGGVEYTDYISTEG